MATPEPPASSVAVRVTWTARPYQPAEQAVPLVQYMIERSLIGRNLADVEERARAVRDGLAFVLPLEDHVRRSEYARFLAGRVGEPEMAVMDFAAPPGTPTDVDATVYDFGT